MRYGRAAWNPGARQKRIGNENAAEKDMIVALSGFPGRGDRFADLLIVFGTESNKADPIPIE